MPEVDGSQQQRPWLTRRTFLRGTLGVGGLIGAGGIGAGWPSPSSEAHASTEGASPRRGGSLRVATGDAVSTDFFLGSALGQHVYSFVQFAWPLYIQSATQREPVNALAESYDVSSDGLTHTCTVRSGLTFHDGSPIDAEAVAENFRSQIFPDHPLRDGGSYLTTLAFGIPPVVDRVEVVDDVTVQIVLTQPRADIRRILWYFYILNPAVLARPDYGTDAGALRDAGSGPFRITDFSPSSFVEFERFDGFFEDVWLDRLRFEVNTDDAAMGLALRAGEIDVAVQLAPAEHDALAADPAYTEYVAPEPGLNLFYELTARLPELEDPRVREAIWFALNQEAYVEAFFSPGTATTSTQPVVVPGAPAYNPEIEDRPYDPDRARSLLSAAGVENLTLKAIGPPSYGALSNVGQLFEAMRSDFSAAGIELEISIVDEATLPDETPNNDITIDPYDYEDDFLVMPIFFTNLGEVAAPDPRATNPEVNRLLTAASEAADPAEQAGHFQRLMKLNHDELLMGIPLALVSKSAIARRDVRDFRVAYTADPVHTTWREES